MVRRTAPRAPPGPTLRNGGGGWSSSSPRAEAAQSTSTSSTHSCLPRPSSCLLPRHPHCHPRVPRRPRRPPRRRLLPPAGNSATRCHPRMPHRTRRPPRRRLLPPGQQPQPVSPTHAEGGSEADFCVRFLSFLLFQSRQLVSGVLQSQHSGALIVRCLCFDRVLSVFQTTGRVRTSSRGRARGTGDLIVHVGHGTY